MKRNVENIEFVYFHKQVVFVILIERIGSIPVIYMTNIEKHVGGADVCLVPIKELSFPFLRHQ